MPRKNVRRRRALRVIIFCAISLGFWLLTCVVSFAAPRLERQAVDDFVDQRSGTDTLGLPAFR